MTTYSITDPSGKVHTIDGPEGATREQVIAKIKERLGQPPVTQSVQAQDPFTQQAKSQSVGENLAAGAGGAVVGMGIGAKQILNDPGTVNNNKLGALLGALPLFALKQLFGKIKPGEVEEHKKAMGGLRSTASGTVGDIAGTVATGALIPGSSLPVAMAAGAGMGGLQPADDNGSRSDNVILGAAGGAAGNLLGRGISKLINPVSGSVNPAGMEAAKRLGIADSLTPAQRTGNLSLQQVEGVLERTPGSAGRFASIKATHQAALNRAAAKSIGENADDLSEEVIARASARIGQQFNDLSAKSNVVLSNEFPKLINKLESTNAVLGPFRNPQVDDLIGKSRELSRMGNIPGQVYQTIRSELTSSADDAYRAGNSSAGKALKQVRDALDDAAKSGLSKDDQLAWDAVRRQYANLSTLLKGKTIKSGDVDQNLINNAMIKYNNKLYKSGAINTPLNDIGKYAETFKNMVPNSGTPERTHMQNMLFGNPLTGLPTMALANLYQRGYMSKPMQKYLTEGLAKLSPQAREAWIRSGTLTGGAIGANLNSY